MLELCKQCIKLSTNSLLANKARSFLTMLGIIIGVSAVIVIMAVGDGAQSLILSQIETLGANTVSIIPGKSEKNGPPAFVMGITITSLTYENAQALLKENNASHITDLALYYGSNENVSWRSRNVTSWVNGTNTGHSTMTKSELAQGRFFTKQEETNLVKVAVLGSEEKEKIFGASEAIGQKIKIDKQSFEVIGVMKEKGNVGFENYDRSILIPIKTMQKLVAGVDYISFIRAKIDQDENITRTINDIENTLREQHDIKDNSGVSDDFTIRSAAQAADIIKQITDALKFFLAAMAAMSLIVGGIGIMNIMLISVTERTNEIGLRKAIGAQNKNLLLQFLIESITITLIGGIIGIILGILVSLLITLVIKNILGYDWKFSLSLLSILMGIGVSTSIGLIFGLYPAQKASKLNPIEALRYE
jgi:putative ABC transport system permease protein